MSQERDNTPWQSRPQRILSFLMGKGPTWDYLRSKGPLEFFRFFNRQIRKQIYLELGKRWDKEHNVETTGFMDLNDVNVVGPNKAEGEWVSATSATFFNYLSRYFPKNRAKFTLIDLGSGQGKVLLMSRLFGFRKIIGVEFVTEACDLAKRNVESFRDSKDLHTPTEVLNLDASTYEFPVDNLMLMLFNPFSPKLWDVMMKNLESSLKQTPRKVILILTSTKPWAFDADKDVLRNYPRFILKTEGVSPYFLDAYLPYYYAVYETADREI